MSDSVNNPKHYNNIPGVECIDVVEHMSFNLGNVVKYVWRYQDKGGFEDLRKALWYMEREISRLSTSSNTYTSKGPREGDSIPTLEQIQREWRQYSGEN